MYHPKDKIYTVSLNLLPYVAVVFFLFRNHTILELVLTTILSSLVILVCAFLLRLDFFQSQPFAAFVLCFVLSTTLFSLIKVSNSATKLFRRSHTSMAMRICVRYKILNMYIGNVTSLIGVHTIDLTSLTSGI